MVADHQQPPENQLARAIAAAFERPPLPVVSVYLFGSQAEGRAHRQSDVDVAVLLPFDAASTERERFNARVQLGSYLIGRLHKNDVDMVILNDAPPEFARRIVTRGQRIACTDAEADHAFVRDIQLRAADVAPFIRRKRTAKLAAISR